MYIPNTWALAIALPYGRVGICEILQAADKALEQRLSFNMSAVWPFWAERRSKNRENCYINTVLGRKNHDVLSVKLTVTTVTTVTAVIWIEP